MGNLSPDEIAMEAMAKRYQALDVVAARDTALYALLMAEHPNATGADGFTAMSQTAHRFNARWPHKVPSRWEMVLADRAGKLSQFTADANRAFRVDTASIEGTHSSSTRQEQRQ